MWDHLREYWKTEHLPVEELTDLLVILADQHSLSIPTKTVDRPEAQPRVALDLTGLEIHDFKATAERSVQFLPGVTVVLGRNESGKSTLIQALEFALRGDVGASIPAEDLVRCGAKQAKVYLKCPPSAEIVRTVQLDKNDKGKRSLRVHIEGEESSKSAEAQRLVELWAGMDLKMLLQTAVIQQGEMTSLLDEAPGPRRELFYRMLGLDVYEETRVRLSEIYFQAKEAADRADSSNQFIVGRRQELENEKKDLLVEDEEAVVKLEGRALLAEADVAEADRRLASLTQHRSMLVDRWKKLALLQTCCPTCEQLIPVEIKAKLMEQIDFEGKQVRAKLDETQGHREVLAQEAGEARAKASAARKVRLRLRQIDLDLEGLQLAKPESSQSLALMGDLVKTFSRQGFPLYEAAKHVCKVNALAMRVLSDPLNAYVFDESLDIKVIRGGSEIHRKLDAGSARQRGALALRVAMSLYQQELMGVRVPLLWIDEMPYQDAEHEISICHMLRTISTLLTVEVRPGKVVLNCHTEPEWLRDDYRAFRHDSFHLVELNPESEGQR